MTTYKENAARIKQMYMILGKETKNPLGMQLGIYYTAAEISYILIIAANMVAGFEKPSSVVWSILALTAIITFLSVFWFPYSTGYEIPIKQRITGEKREVISMYAPVQAAGIPKKHYLRFMTVKYIQHSFLFFVTMLAYILPELQQINSVITVTVGLIAVFVLSILWRMILVAGSMSSAAV